MFRLISAVQVDVVCTSRIPEFFIITVITSAEIILNQLTIRHQPAQAVTHFNISLPQIVDVCSLHVRIIAGNSAGESAPSGPVEVGKVLGINFPRKKVKNNLFLVCSGGITDSTTYTTVSTVSTVSTVTTTVANTQSGSTKQQADNTTLIGEVY